MTISLIVILAFLSPDASFAINHGSPVGIPVAGQGNKNIKKSDNNNNNKVNNFNAPDFAFPQTVDKNALAAYDEGLKSGDWIKVLKAAMQRCVAIRETSSESADSCITILSRVATLAPAPYSSLAMALQASLLSSEYSADSWTYDKRKIPAQEESSSVYLWSADIFKNAITGLSRSSVRNLSGFENWKLDRISELLADWEQAGKEGMTLGDFIRISLIQSLSPFSRTPSGPLIPFRIVGSESPLDSNSSSDAYALSLELARELAGNLQSGSKPLTVGIAVGKLLGLLPASCRESEARKWIEKFSYSPSEQAILCQMEDYNLDRPDTSDFYRRIRQSLKRFPETPYASRLKSILSSLEARSLVVRANGQFLPDRDIDVSVENRNCPSFTIFVVSMPESALETGATVGKASKAPVVLKKRIDLPNPVPFSLDSTVNLGPLPVGVYAILASDSHSLSSFASSRYDAQMFKVCSLQAIAERRSDSPSSLFVVSGENGAPIQDASVDFQVRKRQSPSDTPRLTSVQKSISDADGRVEVDAKSQFADKVVISKGKESLSYSPYLRRMSSDKDTSENVQIFLDRAIAKPGEKVEFEIVAFAISGSRIRLIDNRKIKLLLINASNQKVDSLQLTTDDRGNAAGSFLLPKDGMLGRWILRAYTADSAHIWDSQGSVSIQVEDYKAPAFEVSCRASVAAASDEIVVSGVAKTLSGMPVSNASVSINISYEPLRWYRFSAADDAEFNADCKTDAEGVFELRLDTAGLTGTPFERGVFALRASATDQAGETRSAATRFFIGTSRYVDPQIDSRIEISSDSIRLHVPVRDMLGNPVQSPVRMRLFHASDSGKRSPIIEKVFDSPSLVLSSGDIPSGEYLFSFSLPDDAGCEPVEANTIFWRTSDPVPPCQSPLWVPQYTIYAEKDAHKASIAFGSTFPGQHILCAVTAPDGTVSENWICPDGKMLSVEVPSPAEGERTFVKFFTIRNLEGCAVEVTILPYSERSPLKVDVVAFRDHIAPNAKEQWSFRFSQDNVPAENLSALAVMTDKGLNSLVPFSWFFSPRNALSFDEGISLSAVPLSRIAFYALRGSSYSPWSSPKIPEWRYDFPGRSVVSMTLYECSMALDDCATSGEVPERLVRSTSVDFGSANSMAMGAAVKEKSFVTAESEPEMDEGGQNAGSLPNPVSLREAECPVAFFRPRLQADAQGVVSVDFEVPDFNTTWQFQLLGYTPDLRTASLTLDALSAKPVMVRLNAPAFLRTADGIVLTATAFNNSGSSVSLAGRLEIIDAVSGKLLASKTFDGLQTAPSDSRLLELPFVVPGDVALISVRAFAFADGSSDGEQLSIAVLPSSSPVLESTPFWLAPGQTDFKINLPDFDPSAKITLTYCDNPIWYAFTSLPSLTTDKGISTISIMRALYGNCIACGLISRYPSVRQGLMDILAQSANGESDLLDSPLENNTSLKISNLEFTPWVNSARDETLRMHALADLLDADLASEAIQSCVNSIVDRANPDGGFSWCPGSRSSRWVSAQVLLWNAMLMRFGYMLESGMYREVISKAISFCENEILDSFKDRKPSDAEIESLRDFLYVRSYYLGSALMPAEKSAFSRYAQKCLELVKSNWKNYSLYDKASAATLLARSGQKDIAGKILSSLAEFATRRADRGMWFDAYQGGFFSPWDKLITTAQVLEAYLDIDPSSPDVDLLRQWLIIQRQAEDWADLPYGAELVQAILSSGTDWTSSSSNLQIKLGGKKIIGKNDIPSFGELTLDLDPSKASGSQLLIKRDAESPAWGAVISQYVAPIDDIKAHDIEDIKVSKSVFALREANGAMVAEPVDDISKLKKGDKVRIQLTVVTGRDMEYVVLKDERGACLQPDNLLSESDMVDSVWLYREMRRDETNFFIPYLRKGSFRLSYDCHVSQTGSFSVGIATLQSQYAPSLSAHSAGLLLDSN